MENREIKFRAWHKEWDEMVYSTNMHDWFRKREFYPICFEVGFSHYPTDDEWKIMQFTGLKDKEGNEIYDKDIVRIDNASPYVLKYWNEEVKQDKYGSWIIGKGYLYDFSDSNCEIIGNIYQNPELLEK